MSNSDILFAIILGIIFVIGLLLIRLFIINPLFDLIEKLLTRKDE